MLTLSTTLAIFLILGISSLTILLAKRLGLPHTVLLVVIGIILGLTAHTDSFSFLNDFKLTPELLFYLLLPTLIFESAYNIKIRQLISDSVVVLTLSIVSFLLSAIAIAILLHLLLPLIGINIPFGLALLFGTLISATDPVAVLALFKEYGVPNRLSLIFEGESLFNDATAVAAFLITLDAISHGGLTIISSLHGLLTFFSSLSFGVLYGLVIGGLFIYLLGRIRESEVAGITLTIVLAHITFITSELLSETALFAEHGLYISPIISTTIASILMGNYGRTKLNTHAATFVNGFWEQFAFMANSIIFILIGMIIVNTFSFDTLLVGAVFMSIAITAFSRALSVYPITAIYNLVQKPTDQLPMSWQHLLAWGSLRGALAVTMVLLIPDDFTTAGWNMATSPKEFLLAMTVGCIAFTLFVKATTIKYFVRRFSLDALTPIEEIEYQKAKAIIHHGVKNRLTIYKTRGYIDDSIANKLLKEHDEAFVHLCEQTKDFDYTECNTLSFQVLRIYAIGIEKRNLQSLYDHHEITESVFRRIQGKLQLQLEAIEGGNLSPDLTIHVDQRDFIEKIAATFWRLLGRDDALVSIQERYMYYRAQSIISRKVLKELSNLTSTLDTTFAAEAVNNVTSLYQEFRKNSEGKMHEIDSTHVKEAHDIARHLADCSVNTIEEKVLDDLFDKELITKKLYIILKNELAVKD